MFNVEGFKVVKEEYLDLGEKTNICFLTLANTMEVVGTAIDKDRKKGHAKAAEFAVNRVRFLEERAKEREDE